MGAVIVAQLVERLLHTPEVHSSNPVMGKLNLPLPTVNTVNCVDGVNQGN